MYSIEQRVFFWGGRGVLEFRRLKHNPTTICRCFQNRFNAPVGPDTKIIRMLFAKFEVADDPKGNVGPRQSVVTPENSANVSEIAQQNPKKSIRQITSATDCNTQEHKKY